MAVGEQLCFECLGKGGRLIRLTRSRYEGHILNRHPDLLRDFNHPASWIQMTLENPDRLSPTGPKGDREKYIGAPVMPEKGIQTRRRFHVVVQLEPNNRGHVVTAMTVSE